MRIGHGYDVHKLVEGRKLIMGGVEIPYEKGLLGHSDADVLLHAISDAILGAAALGYVAANGPDQTPEVASMMRYVVAAMYLLAAVVQFVGTKYVYNLDKATLEQMNKELAERK